MFKRKIEEYLNEWQNRDKKKCLVVDGPSRIGKTESVVDFALKNYKVNHIIHIDFLKNSTYKNIFNEQLDIHSIYNLIKIEFSNKNLVKEKSLIIIDNIQECSSAIDTLKPFTIDGSYDVIAIGSYLETDYVESSKLPFGYIDRFKMKAMDFEEFLWANNIDEDIIKNFLDNFNKMEPIENSINATLIRYFTEYMAIGGMPEVVEVYLNEKDFKLAHKVQTQLVENYRHELMRYNFGANKSKTRNVFNSMKDQLYNDYKKFRFGLVSEGGRQSKYEKCIQWLIDAGIVVKSVNVLVPQKPLYDNIRKDAFKLYFHDSSLLMGMLGIEYMIEILKGNLDSYNGAFIESVIANTLATNGFDLYYFEKNAKISVDFLINYHREIVPIEVRKADNPKSQVLKSMLSNYGVNYGVKLSKKNISEKDNIKTYPIYMGMYLIR